MSDIQLLHVNIGLRLTKTLRLMPDTGTVLMYGCGLCSRSMLYFCAKIIRFILQYHVCLCRETSGNSEGKVGCQPVSVSRQPVSDNRQSVSVSRQPVSDSRQPVSDSHQPVSDSRQPVSDSRKPVSDTRKPVSDGRQPVSDGPQSVSDSLDGDEVFTSVPVSVTSIEE